MTELRTLVQKMEAQKGNRKAFFSERSVVADKEIFARLLHNQGKMDELEYNLYLNMYHSLDSLFQTPRLHKFIYLRSSPQMCMRRMLKRARHEEVSIPMKYLE